MPDLHGLPQPDETRISGSWIKIDGDLVADEIARRVDWLVDQYLERIADSPDGWGTLLRDPADGRYWELSHPFSELHGGGPPQLSMISPADAQGRYSIDL